MKDLLTFLISEIVGSTDFSVAETIEGDRVNLQVTTKPELIGLIIGKEGKTIKNIRRILAIRATSENTVVNVSVS